MYIVYIHTYTYAHVHITLKDRHIWYKLELLE